jgi:hypothetical protein
VLTMLIVVLVLFAALGARLILARRGSNGDFVNPWTTWQRPDRFGPPPERRPASSPGSAARPGPPPGHLRGEAPRSPKDW